MDPNILWGRELSLEETLSRPTLDLETMNPTKLKMMCHIPSKPGQRIQGTSINQDQGSTRIRICMIVFQVLGSAKTNVIPEFTINPLLLQAQETMKLAIKQRETRDLNLDLVQARERKTTSPREQVIQVQDSIRQRKLLEMMVLGTQWVGEGRIVECWLGKRHLDQDSIMHLINIQRRMDLSLVWDHRPRVRLPIFMDRTQHQIAIILMRILLPIKLLSGEWDQAQGLL